MNNRERIINCVTGKEIDRTPFICYFGAWGETCERWMKEGAKDWDAWRDPAIGFDEGVANLTEYVNHYFNPPFEFKILKEEGERYIYQDTLGVVNEANKGRSAIPKILKNPVTCREDWEKIKRERLVPDFKGRIPADFADTCEMLKKSGKAIQVGAFPYGVFGTMRDLIGVEDLMFWFYDEPELVYDMMQDLTDFWLGIYEEIAKYIQIDIIHIWEDMSGKTGSMIGPSTMEEFMLPNYRKIKAFADAKDIPVIVVDTDGKCDELIPIFHSIGVNLMLPFEVQAGNDIVDLRRRFPYMSMFGGIEKMNVAKGRDAIDCEMEKIKPLMGKPGYIPQLDHTIPPEIGYQDYLYFCKRLKETCGKK